jgi:hypothetical protein
MFQRGVLTGIQFAIAASASLSTHEESTDNLAVEAGTSGSELPMNTGSSTALNLRNGGHHSSGVPHHRGAVDVFRRYRKDNPVLSGNVATSRSSFGRG